MRNAIGSGLRALLRRFGIDIVRYHGQRDGYPPDFDTTTIAICARVRGCTMTSAERLHALITAVRYVIAADIPGALVECGVWRGGSAMAMLLALQSLGQREREVWLYDNFSGMTEPDAADVSYRGESAAALFARHGASAAAAGWCAATRDEVWHNLIGTGYPAERIHVVAGRVEDSIPATAPEQIAVLRLDTDWYASTRHELIHLFPRLAPNGVLIIDDYGHWAGARQAVDEYFAEQRLPMLLNRIDYTGRIAIKTGDAQGSDRRIRAVAAPGNGPGTLT